MLRGEIPETVRLLARLRERGHPLYALTNWSADIRNASQNYGLGARWKPMPRLETGGDVTYAFDSGKHDLGVISGPGQVASLPEYDYRHTRLKLFARYAVPSRVGGC